jgi:hypothetical protein
MTVSSFGRALLEGNRLVVFQPLHLIRREEAEDKATRQFSTYRQAAQSGKRHHLSIRALYSDSDSVGENGATAVGRAWPSAE